MTVHARTSLSKTQIDRLGDRLRGDQADENDLRLLDMFRRSFSGAYDLVITTLRNELDLKPTGRPSKSTASIREKLRRETIRLSQIQDIAGGRVIVEFVRNQDAVVAAIREKFMGVNVADRRQNPSHGYRAVHAIVPHDGKLIEIQIRTRLQHMWAELSEKFADVVDPAIKYGGGPADVRVALDAMSHLVSRIEALEPRVEEAKLRVAEVQDEAELQSLKWFVAEHEAVRAEQHKVLMAVISRLSRQGTF